MTERGIEFEQAVALLSRALTNQGLVSTEGEAVARTLQRYKYPPDQAPEAIELILKQAEVLSNGWTMA